MTEEVLVAVEDEVMIVIINRPKTKNAINGNVARGIAAAMDQA